ncbi:MAG: YidC/Oxa1 family membrane protein insertase [Lachnospiraceae bacterium]|nr:YidC/Oxa1 family membrane protein insertase [Lachnospiraceae bacterium]
MSEIYLTAYDGFILGPIVKVLGWIMDKIYLFFYSVFGIENVAVSIAVFTLFIYLCLFPLTYKQQKFSALNRIMQPEIREINNKYKGKRDTESMQAKQEETQAVYDKYGVSTMGTCIYLLIQLPILISLYRVFYNVPAYISSIKEVFTEKVGNAATSIIDAIVNSDGFMNKMQSLYEYAELKNVTADFTGTYTADNASVIKDYIIDVLYKLGDSGWAKLGEYFPNISDSIDAVVQKLHDINYIFVLNISDTPWNQIKQGWSGDTKDFALIICSFLVPLLAWGTQMINIKLMPTNNDGNDQMAKTMKTTNMLMPLMSLFFAFTVPVGLGFYWITGSVIRIIQQLLLNIHFKKLDPESIIDKNKEKAAKKAEKRGKRREAIYNSAHINTKSLSTNASTDISKDNQEKLDKMQNVRNNPPAGSMASLANAVKEFDEKNNSNKNNSNKKNSNKNSKGKSNKK